MKKGIIIIGAVVLVGLSGSILIFRNFERQPAAISQSQNVDDSPYQNVEISSFTHPDLFFTIQYPPEFTLERIEEEAGEVILLKSSKLQAPNSKQAPSSNDQNEFQIYISPFDEDVPYPSPERILQDIPEMAIEEPQEILIGERKGIRALKFLSRDASFGKTLEVWFVQRGILYQVTAQEGMDGVIGPILETLQFR